MVDDKWFRGVKSALTVAHAMCGIPYKLIYEWIGNKEKKKRKDKVRKRKNEELDDKLSEWVLESRSQKTDGQFQTV